MGWVMGVFGHLKPGAFVWGTLAMLSLGKNRGDILYYSAPERLVSATCCNSTRGVGDEADRCDIRIELRHEVHCELLLEMTCCFFGSKKSNSEAFPLI